MSSLNRKIQQFTLPLIASNILQIIIAQISLAIISRKSIESMAAVTTIDSFLYSFGGILGVVSLSFNIYGSKSLGEHKKEEFQKFVSSVIVLSFSLGLIFLLIILLFSKQILRLLYGFQGELLILANTYLLIMAPYILFTLLTFVFTNLLKVEKKTNYIFAVSTFSALLQVLLNDVFVNGKLGFQPLGVLGVGLASMLSLAFILMIYSIILRKTIFTSLKKRPEKMLFLMKKAVPLMIQEGFEGILFILAFEAFIARMGVGILATYALISQALMLAKLPTLMYGNAVTVFASEAYGQKNPDEIQAVGTLTFKSSLRWYLGVAIVFFVFNGPIFSLFTTDQSILALIPTMMPVMFLASLTTPAYEIFKYLAQSIDLSFRVCSLTALINSCIILIMLVLHFLKALDFTLLFSLYGLNFLILSLFFYHLARKKLKTLTVEERSESLNVEN